MDLLLCGLIIYVLYHSSLSVRITVSHFPFSGNIINTAQLFHTQSMFKWENATKFISYSQSQTEDSSSIVKVVDHFVVGCVVHLYVPERQRKALHQMGLIHSFLLYLQRVLPTRTLSLTVKDTLCTWDILFNSGHNRFLQLGVFPRFPVTLPVQRGRQQSLPIAAESQTGDCFMMVS